MYHYHLKFIIHYSILFPTLLLLPPIIQPFRVGGVGVIIIPELKLGVTYGNPLCGFFFRFFPSFLSKGLGMSY